MKFFTLFFLSVLTLSSAQAQNLIYPELEVVPKATERLILEEKDEDRNAWTLYMPIQASAIATLMAGMNMSGEVDKDKDEKEFSPTFATMVGGGWLAVTILGSTMFRPYKTALSDVGRIKGSSKREMLMRERLAEEELSRVSRLGRNIRWFSAASNLAAAVYMNDSLKSDSDAKISIQIAGLFSILPLFFQTRWEDTAEEQEKYKKRIYNPISMAPIIKDPFENKKASGVSLVFAF